MRFRFAVAGLIVVLGSGMARSQTAVTTAGGGASGAIPYFTSGSDVEQSVITQSSGNVSVNGNLSTDGTIQASGEIVSKGAGAGFRVWGGFRARRQPLPERFL
jgi:hypothetical protein